MDKPIKIFYTIYQITNVINGYIYIGQHSTRNLKDRYFGGGTDLNKDLKELGKLNFKKEILFIFDTWEEMNNKEIELVDKEFVLRTDTYNILLGGQNSILVDTIPYRIKGSNNRFKRIPLELYNKEIHETLTSNFVVARKRGSNDKFSQISCDIYNKIDYETTAKFGNIPVRLKNSNDKFKKISVIEYNENKDLYETALSRKKEKTRGVSIIKDGQIVFISKDEYNKNKETLVHVNKRQVTVTIRATGERIKISSEEYKNNKDLYKSDTEGYCYCIDKLTGEHIKLQKDFYKLNKDRYKSACHKNEKTANKSNSGVYCDEALVSTIPQSK